MKHVYLFIVLLSLIALGRTANAQDVHLSHIHASPTFLNPAMVGLMNEDLRLIGNYRSQWQTFNAGYRTMIASADMKAFRGFGLRDEFGAGLQIMSDKAGDIAYTTTDIELTLSYLKALNRNADHLISAGARVGFIQNQFDIEKLRLLDEDPTILNGELMNTTQMIDVSAGLGWFVPLINRYDFAYLGFSAFHLNRATLSFTENHDHVITEGLQLYPKYTFHGGGSVRVNAYVALKPSFIFHFQGPHREFNLGTFVRMSKEPRTYFRAQYAIYTGFWLRWAINDGQLQRDALIGALRYDYKDMVFTFSFDMNISDLAKASHALGGPELSVMKYFDFDRPARKRSRVKCPAF
ncbi:MAG: PorP/SprF family type IX secretion system membrane protein [Saprospiraceae bacterium]|nr:PorP/SprF family type IX secretion system membrane protein [Saprospiraceae bacterium]